jgi:hypothetical protein
MTGNRGNDKLDGKGDFVDWIQVIFIVGTLGGMLFYFINKLDADIRLQMQRTDQLYQMFIDLLKEGKK